MSLKEQIAAVVFVSCSMSFALVGCKGDPAARRELEQQGLEFTARAFQGCVAKGNLEQTRLFLKAGIDVDDTTYLGDYVTALMIASKLGHLDIAQTLIAHGADIHAAARQSRGLPREDGKTALMFGAERGQVDVVRYLVDKGAELDKRTEPEGFTALIYAAMNGHTAVVEQLAKRGADLEARADTEKNQGRTALLFAAERGHLDTLKSLKELGAQIDARRSDGQTALMAVALQKKDDLPAKKVLIGFLLGAGAAVDARDPDGRTTLMLIPTVLTPEKLRGRSKSDNGVRSRTVQLARLLIQHGADVNLTEKKFGWSPLMFAAHSGFAEMVALLLKAGARADVTDLDGQTALSLAKEKGFADIVSLLK